MNKSKYHEYLASREWALIKEKVKKRSGGHCERCQIGTHHSVHHQTYERVGHEAMEDLIGLCEKCHEFISGKSDSDPREITDRLIEASILLKSCMSSIYEAMCASHDKQLPMPAEILDGLREFNSPIKSMIAILSKNGL